MQQAYLKSILHYDPNTGVFVWAAPRPKIVVGQRAGSLKKNKGYRYIYIDGKSYAEHRLAWIYMTGEAPTAQIDHINRDRADNRFENLREAKHGENRANSRASNKNGLKGVVYKKALKLRPYVAQIKVDGKQVHLGCFATPEEAHARYATEARSVFGEFANP